MAGVVELVAQSADLGVGGRAPSGRLGAGLLTFRLRGVQGAGFEEPTSA